ncbi:MAG: flagellar filament capping protein FliD, partial [Methylococcales bacterium]|nr:flagellar filament capping protein FliD [Methylococcales bacterium]
FETLQDSITALTSTDSEFKDFSLSNFDDALSISVDSSATNGDYHIGIERLASNHILQSKTFSDKDAIVGTGSLYIKVGSADTEVIEINSSQNTLTRIKDAINNSSADLTAGLLEQGNGIGLILTSSNSGQDNKIAINMVDTDGNNYDLLGLSSLSFKDLITNLEQTKDGINALYSVDDAVQNTNSNSDSSIIDNVSLTLNDAGVSTSNTLTIEDANQDILIDKLNNFIGAYNDVNNELSSLTNSSGNLNDDVILKAIKTELNDTPGYTYNDTSLRDIGLKFDSNSNLASLDINTLNYNIDNELSTITEALNAFSTSIGTKVTSYTDTLLPARETEFQTDLTETKIEEVKNTKVQRAIYAYTKTSLLGLQSPIFR